MLFAFALMGVTWLSAMFIVIGPIELLQNKTRGMSLNRYILSGGLGAIIALTASFVGRWDEPVQQSGLIIVTASAGALVLFMLDRDTRGAATVLATGVSNGLVWFGLSAASSILVSIISLPSSFPLGTVLTSLLLFINLAFATIVRTELPSRSNQDSPSRSQAAFHAFFFMWLASVDGNFASQAIGGLLDTSRLGWIMLQGCVSMGGPASASYILKTTWMSSPRMKVIIPVLLILGAAFVDWLVVQGLWINSLSQLLSNESFVTEYLQFGGLAVSWVAFLTVGGSSIGDAINRRASLSRRATLRRSSSWIGNIVVELVAIVVILIGVWAASSGVRFLLV